MTSDAWSRMVAVGTVARAHGLTGQVVVTPTTDFVADRFRRGALLHVNRGGRVDALCVESVRVWRGRPVVAFAGISGRDAAERMAGCELRVPEAARPALPGGTYYHTDLVGCAVSTTGGDRLGTVERVEGSLESSLLVVVGSQGEVLVPLARSICVEVDTAARRILIDPPPGLVDLNVGRRREEEGVAPQRP